MPALWSQTNILWQILVRVRDAVLKVVEEEHRGRLLPKLGLFTLDVLRHMTLALPVMDMEISALGQAGHFI